MVLCPSATFPVAEWYTPTQPARGAAAAAVAASARARVAQCAIRVILIFLLIIIKNENLHQAIKPPSLSLDRCLVGLYVSAADQGILHDAGMRCTVLSPLPVRAASNLDRRSDHTHMTDLSSLRQAPHTPLGRRCPPLSLSLSLPHAPHWNKEHTPAAHMPSELMQRFGLCVGVRRTLCHRIESGPCLFTVIFTRRMADYCTAGWYGPLQGKGRAGAGEVGDVVLLG